MQDWLVLLDRVDIAQNASRQVLTSTGTGEGIGAGRIPKLQVMFSQFLTADKRASRARLLVLMTLADTSVWTVLMFRWCENTVLQALPTSEVDDTLVWKQGMALEIRGRCTG